MNTETETTQTAFEAKRTGAISIHEAYGALKGSVMGIEWQLEWLDKQPKDDDIARQVVLGNIRIAAQLARQTINTYEAQR